MTTYWKKGAAMYMMFSVMAMGLTDIVAVYAPGMLPYWDLAMYLALVAVLLAFCVAAVRRGQSMPLYAWLCIAYFLLVGIIGSQHILALLELPAKAPVDATGLPAIVALKTAVMFTAFLQLFPLMLMVQYFLLKRMPLLGAVRILNALAAASVGVFFYQAFADHTFLCVRCSLTRFSGLATDLSAYPLLIPILFGFALVGARLERSRPAKRIHLALAVLLVATIPFTGSRDLLGGTLLYACILPLILAGIRSDMPLWRRLGFGAIPLVVAMGLAGVLASGLTHASWAEKNELVQKTKYTMGFVKKDGVKGALFQGNLRGQLFDDAVTMIAQAPFSGWGPGAFYRDLANVSYLKGKILSRSLASPHNNYLHMAVDLGMPGLVGNLLLIVFPFGLGIRAMRRTKDAQARDVLAVLCASGIVFLAMLSLLTYAWFPDVTWAWAALLATMVMLAEREGVRIGPLSLRSRAVLGITAMLVLVLSAYGNHRQAFGPEGYAARQRPSWWDRPYERNCYPDFGREKADGRWCGRDAQLLVRVRGRPPRVLLGKIRVLHPDVGKRPVDVSYGIAGGDMHTLEIADHAWHAVRMDVPSDAIKELPHRQGMYVFLHLDVSRTWSPARDGHGSDMRESGLAFKGEIDGMDSAQGARSSGG